MSTAARTKSTATPPAPPTTPVRSMTGYGRSVAGETQRVTAEVRSVNGRFFKLNVKMPGRFGVLEDRVKTLLCDLGVKRGSVDVNLFFEGSADENTNEINAAAITEYSKQAAGLVKKLKLKGGVQLSSLLSLPNAVKRASTEDNIEHLWLVCKEALVEALSQFNHMREKEGAMMAADIRVQLAKLAEHRIFIEQDSPEALKSAVNRYRERVNKLIADMGANVPVNNDIIERETVLAADRTDVSEELARLISHFEQMESTLTGGGETGKKLDFLTQELFRETNTIGSKTGDERITYRVVDMKGLIEKIREQVQNLE